MMWMLMACAGEGDTDAEEIACGALDTTAVADYETDDDGQIWLDARGSTACDEALYSWWEVTAYDASNGSTLPDLTDILVDDDLNITPEAIYAPLDMVEWAGEDVTFLLAICVEPYDGACWEVDRIGADETSFSVPE
jgi:hypothetical protein